MIKNNLKISLRAIQKNKLTAFINICGLAIAMGAALLIYVYIVDELSYDRYNSKINRTYRVTREFIDDTGAVIGSFSAIAPAFGPMLKNDFGEIEAAARTLSFLDFDMAVEENGESTRVAHEDKVFLVEPEVFKIFDISVLSGNPVKDLQRPFTVMLSEKMAKKYYSNQDVVGKRLQGIAGMKLAATDNYDLEVIGVYKDFPAQSHWHPEFLIAFSTLNDTTIFGRRNLEDYGNNAFDTYVLLEAGTDAQKLEAALPAFLDRNLGAHARANWGASQNWIASKSNKLYLQPVADIHLRSQFADEIEVNGNVNNVYMMGVIALVIMVIACFNFVNLSTARATRRAKEVGMRKVVGALRSQLIVQFLSESVLIALFALLLALAFVTTALPWINDFTGKAIRLDLAGQWPLFAGMITFAFTVGILAGSYPAFIISAFRPAAALKGQQGSGTGKGVIRRVLVITQFAVSMVLIIATVVSIQQLRYLNTRDVGFIKDQIITLRGYAELDNNYDAFYNSLTGSSAIRNMSRSSQLPTGRLFDWWGGVSVFKGDSLVDTGIVPKSLGVDYEFFSTYGIQLAAGRSFSRTFSSDASKETRAFVINETAARRIGWKSLEEGIGKDLKYGDVTGTLIGIVKDFNFESLHHEILPMVFYLEKHSGRNLSVQIDGGRFQHGIAELEKKWREFLPARPFEYQFMSERYRSLYEADKKQSQLFAIFSSVAIFIACLGLFGLATFNTLQRVKEIGIRKVLGASVTNILALLSREIVILIVMAGIIAWPIAWLVMKRWLSTFAYHIDMDMLLYALTGLGTLIVALLTVSVQTLRAALINPSTILHTE